MKTLLLLGGIDWRVFTDSTLEFDDPQKSRAVSSINNEMTALMRERDDQEFFSLFGSLATIRSKREAVHAVRLDQIAIRYFTALYPTASEVSFLEKKGGVQLGERIRITLPDRGHLLYHVKTHSEGRLSEKSTAPKLVNPQELLAYKILELLGFGCEVHFFEKSPEDVYIATLDASFVNQAKKGEFNVFQKAAGRLGVGGEEGYGQSIWGTLYDLRRQISETADAEAWSEIEESLKSDEIAQNFMHQQSTLDIVTRIMRLSDLLNNPENFGFITGDGMLPQLKVIDFRVIEDPTRLKMTDDQFGGYLVGNGVYNYASSHDMMGYVLRNRPLVPRVAHALQIMNTKLANIVDAINRAYDILCTYLQKDIFDMERTKLEMELNTYATIIRENAQFFKAELESWSPEQDRQREEERQRIINRAK